MRKSHDIDEMRRARDAEIQRIIAFAEAHKAGTPGSEAAVANLIHLNREIHRLGGGAE